MDRSPPILIVPTVHLNGTSRDDLLEQNVNAMHAVAAAMRALEAAAPNGRDYYPQAPNAITAAKEQHGDRLRSLADVHKELETIATAIADAGRG